MNKTIYLRDEEGPIWERARELAGDKLSPVIVAALKRFIAEMEAKEDEAKGFERIQVSYNDSDDHGIPKMKAFHGKWVFPPSKPYDDYDDSRDSCHKFAVAVTAKGAAVVHCWREDSEACCWEYKFAVYPSLVAAAADSHMGFAARRAIEKIGVPVEELDI
jgi:hypothetical protein